MHAQLRDVPELGYLASDKPFPRGEIVVKTNAVAKGYWLEPELTKAAFLDDGWFATGDIGERQADGRVVIIDRCKNILKLQQVFGCAVCVFILLVRASMFPLRRSRLR